MSTIETETLPDVFAIQSALDSLFARRAKRELLSADEEGFILWLFRRSTDGDHLRTETGRMAAVLAAQASYVSARDAGDDQGMERAAATLRHLTPSWIKAPSGHPLAVEESQARREVGELRIRRDTIRKVVSCCRIEKRGTLDGIAEIKLPPSESDPVVVEFCRREFDPGHACYPRERSDGAYSKYWVDLGSWLLACRALSAEADRLDAAIPEAEARLAEVSAARAEHERSRAEIYL